MDLSSLVYFTLSNLIHLKFYLILVFVMWSAPRIATSGQVQHRKSAIHGPRSGQGLMFRRKQNGKPGHTNLLIKAL